MYSIYKVYCTLLQVGYLIVEHEECPELLQDKYWDCSIPDSIPYTVAAEKYKKEEFIGSAEQTLSIKESDKLYDDIRRKRSTEQVPAIKLNGEVVGEAFYCGGSGIYEEVGSPLVSKVKNILQEECA